MYKRNIQFNNRRITKMNRYILLILLSLSFAPSCFSMHSKEKSAPSQVTQVLTDLSKSSSVESALQACLHLCEDPSYTTLSAEVRRKLFRMMKGLITMHNKLACYVACRLIEKNDGIDDYTPEERREFIVNHLSLVSQDIPEACMWLLDLETDLSTIASLCAHAEPCIDRLKSPHKKVYVEKIINRLRPFSADVAVLTELVRWLLKDETYDAELAHVLMATDPPAAHNVVLRSCDHLKKWAVKKPEYSCIVGFLLCDAASVESNKDEQKAKLKTAQSLLKSASDRGDSAGLWGLVGIADGAKNVERGALLARATQHTKKNSDFYQGSPYLRRCMQRSLDAFEATATYDELCALAAFYIQGIPTLIEADEQNALRCYRAAHMRCKKEPTEQIKVCHTMLRLITPFRSQQSEDYRKELIENLHNIARQLPEGLDALIALTHMYARGDYGIEPDAQKLKNICKEFVESSGALRLMQQFLAKADTGALPVMLDLDMELSLFLIVCGNAELVIDRCTGPQRKQYTETLIKKLRSQYEGEQTEQKKSELLAPLCTWLLKVEAHDVIVADLLHTLYKNRSFRQFEILAAKLADPLHKWSQKDPEHNCILGLLFLECAHSGADKKNEKQKVKAAIHLKSASEQGYAPASWALLEILGEVKNGERCKLLARAEQQTRKYVTSHRNDPLLADCLLAQCMKRALASCEATATYDEHCALGSFYAHGIPPLIEPSEQDALRCYKAAYNSRSERLGLTDRSKMCQTMLRRISMLKGEQSHTYRKELIESFKSYARQLPDGIDALIALINIYAHGDYGIAPDAQQLKNVCIEFLQQRPALKLLPQFLLKTNVLPLLLDLECDLETLLSLSEAAENCLEKLTVDERKACITKLIRKLRAYYDGQAAEQENGRLITELLKWLLKEDGNDERIGSLIGDMFWARSYTDAQYIATKLTDQLRIWSQKHREYACALGFLFLDSANAVNDHKLKIRALDYLQRASEQGYAPATWGLVAAIDRSKRSERYSLLTRAEQQTRQENTGGNKSTFLEGSIDRAVAVIEADPESSDELRVLGLLYGQGLPPLITRDEDRAVRYFKTAFDRSVAQRTTGEVTQLCIIYLRLIASFKNAESLKFRNLLHASLKVCSLQSDGIDALIELITINLQGRYSIVPNPWMAKSLCNNFCQSAPSSKTVRQFLAKTDVIPLVLECDIPVPTLLILSDCIESYVDRFDPIRQKACREKIIQKLRTAYDASSRESRGELVAELLKWLLKNASNDEIIERLIADLYWSKAIQECDSIFSKLLDQLKKWSLKNPEYSHILGLLLYNVTQVPGPKKPQRLKLKALEFIKSAADKNYAPALWALFMDPSITKPAERAVLFMRAMDQTKKELAAGKAGSLLDVSVEQGVASFARLAESYDDLCTLGSLYAEGLPPYIEKDEARAVHTYRTSYQRGATVLGHEPSVSEIVKLCLTNLILISHFTCPESAAHRQELLDTLRKSAQHPQGLEALTELLSIYAYGGYGVMPDPQKLREICIMMYEQHNLTPAQLRVILDKTKLLSVLNSEKFLPAHYYIVEFHFIASQTMQPDIRDVFLKKYERILERTQSQVPSKNCFRGGLRYCEMHNDPSAAAFFVTLAMRQVKTLKNKEAVLSLRHALAVATQLLMTHMANYHCTFLALDKHLTMVKAELKEFMEPFPAGLVNEDVMLLRRAQGLFRLLTGPGHMCAAFRDAIDSLHLLGKSDLTLQIALLGMAKATTACIENPRTNPRRRLHLCYALAVIVETIAETEKAFRAMIQYALEHNVCDDYVRICTENDPTKILRSLQLIPDEPSLVHLKIMTAMDFYAHYMILANNTNDPEKKVRYTALAQETSERTLKINAILAYVYFAAEYLEGNIFKKDVAKFKECMKQVVVLAKEKPILREEFGHFKYLCEAALNNDDCPASEKSEVALILEQVTRLYLQSQKK